MTQAERMAIFKRAWKKAILTDLYPKYYNGTQMTMSNLVYNVALELFPTNNLLTSIKSDNIEKYESTHLRELKHDMKHILGIEMVRFTNTEDVTECAPGSFFWYFHGEYSRLLSKMGSLRINNLYLGSELCLEGLGGSCYTWSQHTHDNEWEPRLLYWGRFTYTPTINKDGIYVRPNNIGGNNDEVVWRDFWDGICP
tara:strand:+ start:57 stop:647 length:591 start_codon:yes stop_codon:yes gene_type:complete